MAQTYSSTSENIKHQEMHKHIENGTDAVITRTCLDTTDCDQYLDCHGIGVVRENDVEVSYYTHENTKRIKSCKAKYKGAMPTKQGLNKERAIKCVGKLVAGVAAEEMRCIKQRSKCKQSVRLLQNTGTKLINLKSDLKKSNSSEITQCLLTHINTSPYEIAVASGALITGTAATLMPMWVPISLGVIALGFGVGLTYKYCCKSKPNIEDPENPEEMPMQKLSRVEKREEKKKMQALAKRSKMQKGDMSLKEYISTSALMRGLSVANLSDDQRNEIYEEFKMNQELKQQ